MTAQTFILAGSRASAIRLACLWACQKIPAVASDLEGAEALRQLHPRPLRYGLAIYLAKIGNSRLDPVSVALVRGSELTELTAQVDGELYRSQLKRETDFHAMRGVMATRLT